MSNYQQQGATSSFNGGVTYIEDLPELDDIESAQPYGNPIRPGKQSTYMGAGMVPEGDAEKYQKFIRPSGGPHAMSGMDTSIASLPPPASIISADTYGEAIPQVNDMVPKYHLPPGSPSCIDVANHVEICPICNRYYNTDKSVYIIAIVVLAIICILLLKRVLNA